MDHTAESLKAAAMDLGSRPLQVLFDITLPIISPAMASEWLLSFTPSLDDLVIATFTSGPGATTLPMVIFSKIRLGIAPDVNALATLIILVATLGMIAAAFIMNRQEQRHMPTAEESS